MKIKGIVTGAAAAGAVLLTACSTGAQGAGAAAGGVVQVQNVEEQVISVSSREEVQVTPDMAEIVYSVYTQEADAKACQEANGKQLDQVIEMLKGMGFEESSIQTSNYSMNPIYDWDAGQTITGYEMETMVTLSDVPIDQAGEVISNSVSAGVNNIRSVSYLSGTYDEAYQEALKMAIEAASVKAQAMAEAGGCTLGKIVGITEYGGNQQAKYTGYSNSVARAEGAAVMDAGAMNIMPGEISIEADITVEFAIN